MRRLSLIAGALCLIAAPLCAQSRHRGYNANGGWHLKTAVPVPSRRTETHKLKPQKNKQPKPQPAPAPPQKS